MQVYFGELKEESKKATLVGFAYSIIIHCITFSQLPNLDKHTLEKYNLLIPHVKKLCNFIESFSKDEILQYISVNDISDPYFMLSKFYSQSNLELAIEYAEKKLKIILDFFGNQSKEYTESFLQIINLKHLQSKNFTELKRCKILFGLFEEMGENKINELIKITEKFKQCEFYTILGRIYCDIPSTTKNINKAYQIEPHIQKVIDESYAYSEKLYNNAINCLNNSKKEADSEIKKNQILNLYSSIYGELGHLYANFGKYQQSLISYIKSINILIKHKNSQSMVSAYHGLATLYFNIEKNDIKGQEWLKSQGDWKSIAEEYAQKSLDLSEEVFGKKSKEYQQNGKLLNSIKSIKMENVNIILLW